MKFVPLVPSASVTGVVPIAQGGTNSSTALNNNRIMITSGGKIVEHIALTGGDGTLLYTPTGAGSLPRSSNITESQAGSVNISHAIGYPSATLKAAGGDTVILAVLTLPAKGVIEAVVIDVSPIFLGVPDLAFACLGGITYATGNGKIEAAYYSTVNYHVESFTATTAITLSAITQAGNFTNLTAGGVSVSVVYSVLP